MIGQGLVILASVLLACQNIVLKWLFGQIEPTFAHALVLLHLRTGLMLLLLAPLVGPQWRLMPPNPWPWRAGLLSSVCLALALMGLYVAISQLPTGVAITLFSIYPLVTSLWAWLGWGEALSLAQILGLAIVVVGVGLTAGFDWSSSSLWGNVCALGAGCLYAGYGLGAQVTLRPAAGQASFSPLVFSSLNFAVGWVLTGVLVVAVWPQVQFPPGSALTVALGSAVTALAALTAYLCHNSGIHRLGANVAATLSASTPIFTTLLGWLVLQEHLRPLQVLGIAIVTLALPVLTAKMHSKS